MNVTEAAKLLKVVVATMPNTQHLDIRLTANAWAAIMPDVPFSLAQAALYKVLRTKKIPTVPMPVEIIEACKEIMDSQNQNKAPLDFEAWEEVKRKIDFYKQNVEWSHPAIKETVKIIGSRNICGGDYGVADRFMRVYNKVVKRDENKKEMDVILKLMNGHKPKLLNNEVKR